MSPSVEISPLTFKRLQAHAVPLVDNLESVVNRILDYYEAKSGAPTSAPDVKDDASIKIFSPFSPPDLTHTKIFSVEFCHKALDHSQLNWNSLLFAAIEKAKSLTKSSSDLKRLVIVNFVEREKTDEGYRFLPESMISVQQQDANKAWRAVSHVVRELGLSLKVNFEWRQKDGAAFPGMAGQFQIN